MTPDTNQPQAKFPDDTPADLSECTAVSYDNHVFHRLHRTCGGEPYGGAVWYGESELVRVMRYQDSWAVEVPPLERESVDGEDGSRERIRIIEYEMDAEYGLGQMEAYQLADAYMRGEEDLSDGDWFVQDGQEEAGGQQTLDDIVAQ
ncbi:hypothetical protein [Haloarcula sp. K1]|uniref:hypothetical protein n=1 Tax=Haloarcula sp. K1 TaxID=1622207 RepID=UPI0012BA94D2|nr:hypothetical protein [Haloarcula sp. K1]